MISSEKDHFRIEPAQSGNAKTRCSMQNGGGGTPSLKRGPVDLHDNCSNHRQRVPKLVQDELLSNFVRAPCA